MFSEKGCSFLWTQYLIGPPFAAKLVWVSSESGPCPTARRLWTPLNVAAHFERFSLSVHSAEGEHFLQFPACKVARLRMQRKMCCFFFFISNPRLICAFAHLKREVAERISCFDDGRVCWGHGFFQVTFCIFHFDFLPFFKDVFMFFLFNSCFTVFTTTWVSLCFCFVFIWKMNIGAFFSTCPWAFPPWDAQTRGFRNLSLFLFSLLSALSLVKNLYSVKAEGLNSIQFNSI